MSLPVVARWTALALVGLALAAGASLAASRLTSQRVALSSEPLSAGRDLAPPPPVAGSAARPGPPASSAPSRTEPVNDDEATETGEARDGDD